MTVITEVDWMADPSVYFSSWDNSSSDLPMARSKDSRKDCAMDAAMVLP